MAKYNQLEVCLAELVNAAKSLYDHCSDATDSGTDPAQPFVPPDAPVEAHCARRTIMANLSRLQTLVAEPVDLLSQLAIQGQLLGCLHWLGEFQVLACIPLRGSIPFRDIAELAGVPEDQLCRVIRMTATAGFLYEPTPLHVAHTALSAPFVNKPSHLDAAMFMSQVATPSALSMTAATQRFGHSKNLHESAYNIALKTSLPFASVFEQQSKLQRQWPAYLRYAIGDEDSSLAGMLTTFDWQALGAATVVDVGARTSAIAHALSEMYPLLRFVVQMCEPPESLIQPNDRITIERRLAGATQTTHGASIYALSVPSPSPAIPSQLLPARIQAELEAHVGVLSSNANSRMVLTARLLTSSGTEDPHAAAKARLHDLSLLQLSNDRELEIPELRNLIQSIGSGEGRLVVVNELRSPNSATVSFEVRWQTQPAEQINGLWPAPVVAQE